MEFLERPVSQQSFENDLIQLDCVVSDPNAEIAWYKDGQILRSGSVPGIFIQSANDLLIIPAFDLTHEGQYACVALVDGNECLRADLSITFNTMGFFAQTPEDAVAEEGENICFSASLKIQHMTSRGSKIQGGGLILRNLEPEDEGKYTCVLTDVGGRVKARAHAWLFLADPPIIDIPNQPECEALVTPDHVIAGPCSPPFTAGTLCTHECEPGYRRTVGNGRRLCEPAVGWLGIQLTCEKVAQVQEPGSSCNVDMEFLERPVSQQSFENDLIHLGCVVSDPNAEIAWYKDDRRLRTGSVPGIYIQSANDLLIIPSFDLTHEGQYACVALVDGNECLRADLSITYNMLGFFELTPVDAYAEEGGEHMFHCTPEDPKYVVTWFKGDERISSGPDIIEIPGGGLILRNLEPEDEGKYTCVLTDVEGRVKARAHALLFLAAPPILDIPNRKTSPKQVSKS
ncbi:peroxidasin homolog [Diadema antillarum]|uniref:peroxidasin homolog n=1 Tax=Diadema antillarum TaxID=105358 RepID=UPI003A876CAB